MQFEVIYNKTGKVCKVYSVQLVMTTNAIGQTGPTVLFLIFNEETAQWELVESCEFTPVDFEKSDKPKKKEILGSSKIVIQ